jgi:hypothetical protein
LVASVRVGTRNDLVRQFAATTQDYVNRHIGYLESTGLVDYSALPDTPSPGLLSGSASWRDLIVPGLVLIACLLIAVGLGATLRGRSGSGKASAAVAPAVARRGPRIATAKSLIALHQARTMAPELPEDDLPTGSFPPVGGTGDFPSVDSGSGRFTAASVTSTSGGYSSVSPKSSTKTASTGGFSSPRTPGRGVPYPEAVSPGVTETGPRHAVRR